VEVGEQVLLEGLEGVDDRLARRPAVVMLERVGGGLDSVEIVGDAAVLGLKPVDDRRDHGVGVEQLAEELAVLGVVVEVDEAAVAQAADL